MKKDIPTCYNNKAATETSAFIAALLSVLVVVGGCQQADPRRGYTSKSLHRDDAKTVCVKMFQSQSFRRNMEYELTRALAQRIELHTPYKVVSDARKADTILYGTVRNIAENALAQQHDLDRPLANQMVVAIDITWKDLRNGELLIDNQRIRVSGRYWDLLAAGADSAAREAANEAAIRIVQAMEQPW